MRGAKLAVAVAAQAVVAGCATVTGSETQDVLLSAKTRAGEPVEGAQCTLQNPRGEWKAATPSSVTVRRSAEDMQIDCRKDGHPAGLVKLISRAHGGMFGNIVFGGGIGALIDHSEGTGYDYPNNVTVVMGESLVLDRNLELEAERRRAAGPERK